MPWSGLQTVLPGIMAEYKISDHLNIGAGFNFYRTEFQYSKQHPSGARFQRYDNTSICELYKKIFVIHISLNFLVILKQVIKPE